MEKLWYGLKLLCVYDSDQFVCDINLSFFFKFNYEKLMGKLLCESRLLCVHNLINFHVTYLIMFF